QLEMQPRPDVADLRRPGNAPKFRAACFLDIQPKALNSSHERSHRWLHGTRLNQNSESGEPKTPRRLGQSRSCRGEFFFPGATGRRRWQRFPKEICLALQAA